MEKSGWKSIFLKTETAKLYARNKVAWTDNAGYEKSGIVSLIMGDYVSVKGNDGTTYVVGYNKLKKKINL